MAQGAVAHLTDDIKAVVGVCVLPQKLEQVLVISTCHALIGSKHQIRPPGVFQIPLMEEGVLRLLRQMRHNTGDGIPHTVEVRGHILVVLPCLAQLGRRDQVHGIGDLHGVLNALDALLQQLTGRHGHCLPHKLSKRSGWHPPGRAPACRQHRSSAWCRRRLRGTAAQRQRSFPAVLRWAECPAGRGKPAPE